MKTAKVSDRRYFTYNSKSNYGAKTKKNVYIRVNRKITRVFIRISSKF